MSLYMVAQVAQMPLQRVVAGAIPFLWPLFAALAVITFVPSLSTWLPNLIVK
jgi:TRAP-type C4-dicarboxylate transport system permease large subunit